MRSIKISALAICLVITGMVSAAFVIKNNHTTVDKGFAVIELFTSEGCSSCPPADELVARIQKESAGRPVYILAYHVDYWNRLGWKDVFSSADYSHRQGAYAKWLKLNGVYTPQAVVNGSTEMVGSAQGTLRNSITSNLNKTPTVQLSLQNLTVDKHKATIKYTTEGAAQNTTLLLALIQKNATTKVKNGENSGRTLSHVQIVRGIKTVALDKDKTGQADLSLPDDFIAQGWEVIGLVQNTNTGQITAASRVAIAAATMASN
ncbi:DUF1223 domain-containing protein [Inquilinus sp. KBS0705]|nr:DUF1223 domain-containing protein [Inquilinus sp. KBS0705]